MLRRAARWRLPACFRPIAEVVVPTVPIYFLATVRPARRTVMLTALVVFGFLAVMVPALVGDLLLRGGVSSGALGEHLLWRITRSDSGYITRDDRRRADADPSASRLAATCVRQAADRTLPQQIFEALVREQGLTEGEADSVMRGVALEAIGRQPSLPDEHALDDGRSFSSAMTSRSARSRSGTASAATNPQARQRTWFEDRILYLGAPPDPAVQNELDSADAITRSDQPGGSAG